MHLPKPARRTQLARTFRLTPLLLAASLLSACLGNHDGEGRRFSNQVVFGDSLSDVGTYAVGAIAATHGGKFTVNSIPASAQNWSELVAARLSLPTPCAAQTGLEGDPAQGYYVPVTYHDGCTNYAQGGARVTEAIGPHHKSIEPTTGFTTVPVITQIQNHLNKSSGSFSGSEVVFVFAGGNDFLWQSDAMTAAVVAALPGQVASDILSGACVPVDTAGSNCLGGAIANAVVALSPTYIASMELAGTQLAALINNDIVGKGARYVVVLNLPDVSKTPSVKGQPAGILAVISAMSTAFNSKLAAGLAAHNTDKVLQIDLAARFGEWAANPASFGFSNFTDPACNLTKPSPNLLGSALTCSTNNVIAGDVSRYAYADTVHVTPYTDSLTAEFVLSEMAKRGWR